MADAAVLYAVQRGYHPRLGLTPTREAGAALPRILAECGSLDRATSYLAWVHESQDHDARRLRGEVPWPDGNLQARHDLESLSRHTGARLSCADAWEARGRTDLADKRTAAAPAVNVEADAAWSAACRLLEGVSRGDAAPTPRDAHEARLLATFTAAVGLGAWHARTEWTRREMRSRFIAAWAPVPGVAVVQGAEART